MVQRMNTFHCDKLSPAVGNLQMISSPKNWLLHVQRQKQSSNQKFRVKEPLRSQMLPRQVYSDCISPRFPMAFYWRQTQKFVFMEQAQLLFPSTSADLYLLLSLLPFHWEIRVAPLIHLLCSLWKSLGPSEPLSNKWTTRTCRLQHYLDTPNTHPPKTATWDLP